MKEHTKQGTVTLIGAGCGSCDLITLRGLEALRMCDTVIYDSLIDVRLLDVCSGAEKICVGKRAGRHSASQQEINELLVEKAKAGKTVARLKGGDPFVFGRGSEEINALRENSVPFRIIPGVTSCVAVPELAGIPVTHRRMARSFHVITGHTADDILPENFAGYAKCGGTLVFLMGLRNIDEIAKRLIHNGMSPATPAAVISNGASLQQRTVRALLCEIAQKAREEELSAPAIIVVGETARFDLSADYHLPLEGVTVAVTSTPSLSKKLTEKLGREGAYAFRVGNFSISELFSKQLDKSFESVADYSTVVLTSPNGAEIFLKKLHNYRIDIRSLGGVKIAAIGCGTAQRLENSGLYPDIMPDEYTAAALGKRLAEISAPSEKLLILRSSEGSPELTVPLIEKNITFDDVHIYEPVYGGGGDITADYAVFTSAGGARNFFSCGGTLSGHSKAVAIGEITAAQLKKFGIENCLIPAESSADGIVNIILEEEKCVDSDV